MKYKAFYSYPVYASFVRKDEQLLKEYFEVRSFHFNQRAKWKLPFEFVRQFFTILADIRNIDLFISFFAGYSSFIPALFSKIFHKPHFVILGGTDCTSLPEINYGNFRKKLLGYFTRKSIEWSSHIFPVSQNLIQSEYHYTKTQNTIQGYKRFCKNAKAPATVIPIEFNASLFNCQSAKVPNLFLCVAEINQANYFRKGIDLIIQLANHFSEYQFIIIGDTGYKFQSVPENLTILPFMKYDELLSHYCKAEFYLQLSMMEGFPSAPCEAMLCECIPIVSKVGAMPEIVGDAGFILEKKNIKDLISLVNKAINADRILVKKYAKQRIINRYSNQVRKELIEIIFKYLPPKSSHLSP